MKKNKIKNMLSIKNVTLASVVAFVLTLLPIVYLAFINRASGDDYGYAVLTKQAWDNAHSLTSVFEAACRTIRQSYYGWQGTWFTIFIFALQPEVFSDKAYVATTFIMLFLWIGSTFLLFMSILVSKMKLDKWSSVLITIIFLMISMQFIPGIKSSLFWFNGCVHYMLPFAMCQLLVYLLLKYRTSYKAGYLVLISILMGLLGGANYQAALFALIAACYAGIADFGDKKDRRILRLCLPLALEAAGLFISMKAPGNKVRAGNEFGFSADRALNTIGMSFVQGIRDIGQYMWKKPLAIMGLLLIFVVLLQAVRRRTREENAIKHPLGDIILLFCLYCAMQAPELYAGVEVSRGVDNTNYQVFLLTAVGILLVLTEWAEFKCFFANKKRYKAVIFSGLLICLLMLVIGRRSIKTSTWWICKEYITSGQAADFKYQMDLQTRLLTDEKTVDVVLPFINDDQGPLMHMPVTDDPEAWTNTVTRNFYGKNSVIAMPRPEWEQLYGK